MPTALPMNSAGQVRFPTAHSWRIHSDRRTARRVLEAVAFSNGAVRLVYDASGYNAEA